MGPQHCLAEPGSATASFLRNSAWGSYPPVLFKRKFPVPITLPVLSRRHPGEFSESRGKLCAS